MEDFKKTEIGVLTFPFNNKAGQIILKNFLTILVPLSCKMNVITGIFPQALISSDNINLTEIRYEYPTKDPVILKITKYLIMQLRVSFNLLKMFNNAVVIIFFLGASQLLLPLLTAKLMGKKTIAVLTQKPTSTFEKVINLRLFGMTIVYSKNLIKEWNLEKYRNKISIAYEHFLDFSKFEIKKKLSERNNLVGYIGRLSKEKGVMNFFEAIPKILEEGDEIKFLIVGEGHLRDEIEKYLEEKNLNDKVKLVGWIPHDKLPNYLNELKLLVLPSYTEGLPNIVLEAMACGTPVLATPVGAIPDVIRDGKTGFIMKNNSPECIAKNVIRALEHPDLERVVESARALVEQEFTYEKIVKRWREILESI